jgi:Tfp pilus assembly protein PilZ
MFTGIVTHSSIHRIPVASYVKPGMRSLQIFRRADVYRNHLPLVNGSMVPGTKVYRIGEVAS